MTTTATAPKDVLSDRKIQGLLDDLVEDTDDTIVTAKTLQRSTAMRQCSSAVLSNYGRAISTLETAFQNSESERGTVLAGKAKDLKKFKSLLQIELDALTNLQEQNGRFEVLEDADIGAAVATIIAALGALVAPVSEMGRLQREVESIRSKLQAAIRAARDTKVKAILAAGMTATVTIVAPLGLAVTATAVVGKFAAGPIIDAVLQEREDSTVKNVKDAAAMATRAGVALEALPKAFGPLADIVSGAVDISECFAAERDKQALIDQLKKFMADFKKAAATYITQTEKLAAAVADAQATLADAIAAVKAFKPVKGSYHALLRMI